MENAKWYIVDFNQNLGHDVIYELNITTVSACRIDGKPGFKLKQSNGDVIYCDHESAHTELELAKDDYITKMKNMEIYSKTFLVHTKILQDKITISENDKK